MAVLLLLGGFLISANVILGFHAVKHLNRYRFASGWPRIAVNADSVDLVRVVTGYETRPGTHEEYDAIIKFRYSIGGTDYSRHITRTLASKEEGERLKASETLTFLYNPENPQETIDRVPGPWGFMLALAGLVFINGTVWPFFFQFLYFFGGVE